MTDLEKIIYLGILKNNEEIYLDYIGQCYKARIVENGKKISTDYGDFYSLSAAASPYMLSNEQSERKQSMTPQGQVVNNGWNWWKTWNGIRLQELRKMLND